MWRLRDGQPLHKYGSPLRVCHASATRARQWLAPYGTLLPVLDALPRSVHASVQARGVTESTLG